MLGSPLTPVLTIIKNPEHRVTIRQCFGGLLIRVKRACRLEPLGGVWSGGFWLRGGCGGRHMQTQSVSQQHRTQPSVPSLSFAPFSPKITCGSSYYEAGVHADYFRRSGPDIHRTTPVSRQRLLFAVTGRCSLEASKVVNGRECALWYAVVPRCEPATG
jgi:hypothetical protein